MKEKIQVGIAVTVAGLIFSFLMTAILGVWGVIPAELMFRIMVTCLIIIFMVSLIDKFLNY